MTNIGQIDVASKLLSLPEHKRRAAIILSYIKTGVKNDEDLKKLIKYGLGLNPNEILQEINFNDAYSALGGVQLSDIQKSIEFFEKMQPGKIDLSKASQEVRDFAVFFPDVNLSTPEGFEQFMAFRKQMAGPGGSSDVKDFQLFFPDADIETPEGYQQFLRYKAQTATAGRKPTTPGTTSQMQTDLSNARTLLEESKGKDLYIDPYLYRQLRGEFIQLHGADKVDQFDETFGIELSPQERVNLGLVGGAAGIKATGAVTGGTKLEVLLKTLQEED